MEEPPESTVLATRRPPIPPLPPAMEEPPAAAMVAVLTDDFFLPFILKRLSPVDLVRAAFVCQLWRHAAALAIPRAPPLLGYFIPPRKPRSPPPMARAALPVDFVPCDASWPRLSLTLAPDDSPDLAVRDVHLGLVLLLPGEHSEMLLPRILVLDPASRRRALLPPPPRDAVPDDQRHQTRCIIGAAVLSRAHPSRLAFEVVCVTLDEDRPCPWVASVRDDDCIWRTLPPSKQAMDQLEHCSFDNHCVHAEGTIYWRVRNSSRLLALDPHSMEFSLVPASADLERHFSAGSVWKTKLGIDSEQPPIFPYALCWPPEFLTTLKGGTWTENVMQLIRIAIHNISFLRRLFDTNFFRDISTMPSGMKVKELLAKDDESERLLDWIDKGVFDALQKKYLRNILFGVFQHDGSVIEEYCVSVNYGEGVAMGLTVTGCTESIWTLTSNAVVSLPSQMWSSAWSLVEKMVSLMSTWDQIPGERLIMMKLLYYEDVTPMNYEPPFFQCFPDSKKDVAFDPNTEISQGYLYCITKKKVDFYFDSGASYHLCGNRNLFKNLHKVPVKERDAVYDASGTKMILHEVGEVQYEEIQLSRVFYYNDINYNIISLGQLDDGNNLILLGDKRVKIFDVSEGVMIGEGYMHRTRNEYIVRSIRSIKAEEEKVTDTATLPSASTESIISKKAAAKEERELWLVDSLCNNHMTGNKRILCDRRFEANTFVTPKGTFQATEIGTVKTDKLTLFNVYYCPEIRSNIISEGQLDRDGYSCTRYAHKVNIQYRATQEVVGVAYQDGNFLYYAEYCRYAKDPSSRNDDKPAKNLKQSRQAEQSSSTSRKRFK